MDKKKERKNVGREIPIGIDENEREIEKERA